MDIKLIAVCLFFALILNVVFLCIYYSVHCEDKLFKEKKKDIVINISIISIILLYINSLYLSSIFSSGYGNKIFAIIMQIIFSLCWMLAFIGILVDFIDNIVENVERLKVSQYLICVIFILIFFLSSIYTIGCFYCRLRLENILRIGWIDDLIDKCKNIKFLDNMPKIQKNISEIVENEWFKGITMGVISGTVSAIIAGLILNRLNKRRKGENENKNNNRNDTKQ